MKTFRYNIISLSLLASSTQACADMKSSSHLAEVSPTIETRSHFSNDMEFFTDVDDPAIWIHPTDKSRSVVITALKKGGFDTHSLDGNLLQHIVAAQWLIIVIKNIVERDHAMITKYRLY